jgi:hypothetical protein
MRLTRRVLVALVLGAWAASLAPTDARQRGAKHVANTARVHHPAGGFRGPSHAAHGSIFLPPARGTGKNAIGVATPPVGVGLPAPAAPAIPGANAAGVKANAIGARVGLVGFAPAGPRGTGKIIPGASPAVGVRPATPALSAYGAGISGTGMRRPGIAPGTIGGPAKIVAGITGTGMNRKK